MATIKKNQFRTRQFGGFSPFGNTTSLLFALATTAAGAVIDSNSTAAVAAADVIDLGPLPEGMRLDDATVKVITGMTATITGSLGFVFEDGANHPDVAQDPAYFGTGLNLATPAVLRSAAAKATVVLPKPARLVLTIAVAANAKVSAIEVLVQGELLGPR